MITRWICKNCSKKWIYPIGKCIHCKGNIEKQIGRRLKVIGMTKVNITSALHPFVPYNIILLEDEHGNRIPKKTTKDFSIGDAYAEPKASSDDAVAVVKAKYDIKDSLIHVLELINFNFNKNQKYLIKPNVVYPSYPYQGATTNPEVLKALLEIMLENGINNKNMIIAERGTDINSEAATKSGISEVCKKYDIEFKDISNGPFVKLNGANIYKYALESSIINIPVMKTNDKLGISGAIENLTRVFDSKTINSASENFNNGLPKLIGILKSGLKSDILTIGDAAIGMQGPGPISGEPAFLNLILASKDFVALDSVFCHITMLGLPEHVKQASQSGIGKSNIKDIEVVGNELESLKYPIKKPKNY